MPYYDLNVPWAQDEADLHRSLTFLHELGYKVVALNHAMTGKIPNVISSPIPKELPFNLPPSMRVLRRCTLTIDELPPNNRLQALGAEYDMLALRPTNEKSLQGACTSPHCDLISLDLTQRFETYFKIKTLAQAYDNNIMLEICYAPGILSSDATARRNLMGNATQLIRNSRSRGIVMSSGALKAHGCRAPADVINLAAVWGLGQERGKEAVEKTARSAVVAAALKRSSWRGVVDIVHGGANERTEEEKLQQQQQQQQQPQQKPGQGQKRKADALSEFTISHGQPKQMSKTQLKKQRKLQAQREAEEKAKDG